MNILYVCNDMELGGSPVGIVTEAAELKKRGHNIYVISKGGALEEQLKIKGIEHVRENLPGYSGVINPSNKTQLLKNSCINMLKCIRNFRITKSIHTINKVIKSKKIDVIYSCQPGPTQAVHLAAKMNKVPFIIRVQHVILNEFPPIAYKKVVRDSAGISVITKEIQSKLKEFYKIKDKEISIIPTGVDLSKFENVKNDKNIQKPNDIELKPNQQVVLNVSTHGGAKYLPILNLAKSMEYLGKRYSDLVCVLVGDGDNHHKIQEEADRVNAVLGRKAIYLVGSKKDVRPYLKIADMGLGVGRVAMEMLVSGSALICASHQAFGGLLKKENIDEIAGYNFSGRNTTQVSSVENIIQSVEEYMNLSAEEQELLKEFGKQYMLENYSLSTIIDTTEQLLYKCMNK